MAKRMDDLNWRLKGYRCMLLSLIPVFYFSGLLFMGKKAKQESYTKLGLFFGALSLITFIIGAMGLVFRPLFYALVLNLGGWAMCIMQMLRLRQQYQQYLEWAQEDAEKERDPMVFQKSWRWRNALWCFWDCIPLLGGLATYFMGRRMENKPLKWFAVLSTLSILALFVYFSMMLVAGQALSNFVAALAIIVVFSCVCVHPLLAGFFFEDYLDATAAMWKEDGSDYPQMMTTSWRVKNSLWQMLTCIPYVGSLGLFFVGIGRESGKVLLGASVLCVAEMACVAGPSILLETEALQAWPMLEGLADTIGILWFLAYILIVFYGTVIHWDMLRAKAAALEEAE